MKTQRHIAALLNTMGRADQENIRNYHDSKVFDRKLAPFHTQILKLIIDRYGWPTTSLVGKRAARSAWLIAQHSDHDSAFQQKVLALVQDAYTRKKSDVPRLAIPYLTDRILVIKGKRQIYGTQFNSKSELYPVVDRKNLNARRKQFRLGTIENLLKEIG